MLALSLSTADSKVLDNKKSISHNLADRFFILGYYSFIFVNKLFAAEE
jgi:hypothetical protein